MDRVAVVGRFRPEAAELVRTLLAAGPPYDPAATGIDRHAVYLTQDEVVFVFEGEGIEWELEDLADDFFHRELRATITEWRGALVDEPRIGRPVFVWERGGGLVAGVQPPEAATVADVMDTAFVRIAPDDTLGEAVERLVAGGGGPGLVDDYGHLIGLLGAGDVLRATAERVHPSEARVREWMTPDPVAVGPNTSLDEAAAMMVSDGLHELAVVEEGRPVGLVSLHATVAARSAVRV